MVFPKSLKFMNSGSVNSELWSLRSRDGRLKVPAQIGSGLVRGGPEVRFNEGSTRVPRGSARTAGWCEH